MEEPHGETHDLQLLAAAAEDDDAPGAGDALDDVIDGGVVESFEDSGEFGERGLYMLMARYPSRKTAAPVPQTAAALARSSA